MIFLAAAGLLAMFFFQTLYLQRVLGFGPLKTGLSFLPFSASMGIASAIMVGCLAASIRGCQSSSAAPWPRPDFG
ncbi:MAG: hypothetical protein ACR2NR_09090 [Solirubrobacteraceae bacterium]